MIHLAFNVALARSGDFQGAAGADRRAVEALGGALTGSDRPLVIASATVVLAPGRVGTAQDAPGLDPVAAEAPRGIPRASAAVPGRADVCLPGVRAAPRPVDADIPPAGSALALDHVRHARPPGASDSDRVR